MTDLEKLLAEATPSPWRLFNVPFANQKMRQRVGPFLLVGEVSDADATLGSMAPDMAAALIEAREALNDAEAELGMLLALSKHCGDPAYECPMQDAYSPNGTNAVHQRVCAALTKINELTKGE